MKISEVMTREVRVAGPDMTLAEAARLMEELDAGVLPVSNSERLIGMVTDRDIAIRGIGQGLGPKAKVSEVMTEDVKYCYDDDSCDDIARNMGELQLRRLPVVSRDKRLVGIVSLGDLAVTMGPDGDAIGDSLAAISRPNGSDVHAH
ncbi:inosine-5-monophosphate dehydrogenase [Terrihabitans soli]|uniref:Inosine-5-monophosphate dehydrogenase n=1 Tax=Terrihabitans soli TaxID=708113 RepID=A0A6S6QPV8_9HYPH|nr:CBS domain-containing protein [Terrihabitans soli]BCJ89392.1 inosine-5-monophosphate dehydrogenase [Terrihabitans soli]